MKNILFFGKLAILVGCLTFFNDLKPQSFTTPLPIPPLVEGPTFNLHVHDSVHNYGIDTVSNSVPSLAYDLEGSNGLFKTTRLGPTFHWIKGDSVTINVKNNLNETTTIHWHGAHVPPKWDGGPNNPVPAGSTWNPKFKILDDACTMWYHPHLHHSTYKQVSLGLAGLIRITDPAEPIDTLLPHHYGKDDIPLILQQLTIKADTVPYKITVNDSIPVENSTASTEGFFPQSFLVNGVNKPKGILPKQVVRLRILNGAASISFKLAITHGSDSLPNNPVEFNVVTADAGYLDSAYKVKSLIISPGERWEITLDVNQFTEGDSLTLWQWSETMPKTINGHKSFWNLSKNNQALARFIVGPQDTSFTPITSTPAVLASLPPLPTNISRSRTKNFTGNFPYIPLIDLLPMNHAIINDYVMLGSTEEWEIINRSNEGHPFHIHDSHFWITDTTASDTSLNSPYIPITSGIFRGPKDVLIVPAYSKVKFRMKFLDFSDSTLSYMYHCHILAHEDQGMMHQFLVWDTAWPPPPFFTYVGFSPEVTKPEFTLFPNPTNGELWIKAESKVRTSLKIIDSKGSLVASEELPAFSGQYEISGLRGIPSGNYVVLWETSKGLQVRKIILQ